MLTKEHFREIYTRYEQSGLCIRDFCSKEGMGEAKFYYWQKKMGKAQPAGFVPVVIEKEKELPPPAVSLLNNVLPSGCSFEITYPCGTYVKLTGKVDYELIRSLILINSR
jgi:hypothetical protein